MFGVKAIEGKERFSINRTIPATPAAHFPYESSQTLVADHGDHAMGL